MLQQSTTSIISKNANAVNVIALQLLRAVDLDRKKAGEEDAFDRQSEEIPKDEKLGNFKKKRSGYINQSPRQKRRRALRENAQKCARVNNHSRQVKRGVNGQCHQSRGDVDPQK